VIIKYIVSDKVGPVTHCLGRGGREEVEHLPGCACPRVASLTHSHLLSLSLSLSLYPALSLSLSDSRALSLFLGGGAGVTDPPAPAKGATWNNLQGFEDF
jgi:hypothetical protein